LTRSSLDPTAYWGWVKGANHRISSSRSGGSNPRRVWSSPRAAWESPKHLLDLTDEAILGRASVRFENRPELVEREPGPIILLATTHLHDALMAQ
jgi:hypothetical protein